MNSFKNIKKGILVILIYFISNIVFQLPLLNINTASSPLILRIIYSLSTEIIILSLIMFVLKEEIKNNLLDLKKNYKTYFKSYFKYWFLIIGIMMFSNLLISILFKGITASNQQAINDMFDTAPIYTFISAVFFAPILEELVFRLGIRKIFKNKYLFIIVSGIVFGGLHVVLSMQSIFELFYLIPYCTPGFIFAYLLYKTDNIFVPAFLHFFHNGIILSIQILALILG